MKIAIYLDGKKHGGVDTHLLALLKNWPNKKDEFSIFHNRDNNGVSQNAFHLGKIPNLRLIPYKRNYWDRLRIVTFFFNPLIFFYQIIRGCFLLKINGKFDVLISNNGGFPGASSCLAVIFSAYFLKIPKRLLLIHHAAMPKMPIFTLFRSIKDIGLQRCATDLVAVSLATRTSLIERRYFNTMVNPIHVIPNGIDLNDDSVPTDINLKEQYNILKTEIVIGMVGRVERYKGQEDLIIGMSRLPEEILNKFKILIVGSGESKEVSRLNDMLKKYFLQDRVIFTGFIKNKPEDIISCFDILFMLTKDFEAFNYTIAEAMTIGVPTIITDVGAIREYYNSEITKIIPPESPDMVCEAIIEYAEDPISFKNRAGKAKNTIRKFSAQRMAFGFYDLIS